MLLGVRLEGDQKNRLKQVGAFPAKTKSRENTNGSVKIKLN